MDYKDKKQTALALIGFAVLSFVTALFFNMSTGKEIVIALPPEGGIIGPITVEKERQVYQITVAQNITRNGQWNHVEGAVLDENKNHLFSFGEEFWKESGYDVEGSWSERKTDYTIKVTLQKGIYYLGFDAENVGPGSSKIHVIAKPKGGSVVPLFTAGVILLIMGVIMNEMASGSIGKGLKSFDSSY